MAVRLPDWRRVNDASVLGLRDRYPDAHREWMGARLGAAHNRGSMRLAVDETLRSLRPSPLSFAIVPSVAQWGVMRRYFRPMRRNPTDD